MDLLERPALSHESARETGTARLARLHSEFVRERRFAAQLSPNTLASYREAFARLTALMPTITVEQLVTRNVTTFFERLECAGKGRRSGECEVGVKPSTVASYRSRLNQFFMWLQRGGEIAANPLEGIPYPRVSYEDKKYLGRSDVERIFAALVLGGRWRSGYLRKRNVAVFAMLLCTGVRKGELVAMRVADLDLNRLEVVVRAETSKSRLRRTIPLNSQLLASLEDYLEERRRRGLQTEHLFASSLRDAPLTANGLIHLIKQVQRRSGVRFHAHQFRHTFAVNLLNQGCDVAKLRQLLGHRDIRMTSAYLRVLPSTAMRADLERLSLEALV